MDEKAKSVLEKQQYAFTGRHSAVKLCTWTKKALRGQGHCYKQQFYGIQSHRCVQMTPTVNYCQNRCIFCWRPTELTEGMEIPAGKADEPIDTPEDIIKNCLIKQKKLLSGFGGYEKVDLKKLKESQQPKHFAISLSGEPTIYPKLNELIRELHQQNYTTFVVSNGMLPDRLAEIEPPTQLYLSVDAPNEELFKKIDQPMLKDGWQRLGKSLAVLKKLNKKTRTALRLTMIKGLNMVEPEEWANLIKIAEPMFVEIKAYMFVGFSRQRLKMENMPQHAEVREFALEIAKHCDYQIVDEKKESRVVLMMKEDKGRKLNFED
jgi:tRNA wybutosine-synthesizing protein 1